MKTVAQIWKLFGQNVLEKSKKELSEFFGYRNVIGICYYEIDEHFATGLVIFGGVFI